MHDFEFEVFYRQVIANLPYNENEIRRFLKYARNLFFFSKSVKSGKFPVESVNMILFQKKSLFSTEVQVFLQKIRQFLYLEKLEK